MKKLLFLLAVAGLFAFAACKSGENKAEATADSTQVVEQVDTTAVATPDTTQAQQ